MEIDFLKVIDFIVSVIFGVSILASSISFLMNIGEGRAEFKFKNSAFRKG